jgi:hypothetical protein
LDGAELGGLSTTSTSTVPTDEDYLDEAPDEVEAPSPLRMFNVNAIDIELALGEAAEPGPYDTDDGTVITSDESGDEVWGGQKTFMKSDESFAFSGSADDTKTVRTAVPSTKYIAAWTYEKVDSYEETGGDDLEGAVYGRRVSTLTDAMAASYSDPCVVPVPKALGGGYLMILVRRRVLADDAADAAASVSGRDASALSDAEIARGAAFLGNPGESIADIVCYYSTSVEFTSETTKGPFLLVHSLTALRDPSLRDAGASSDMASFRCWLGVPGAVFVGWDLYLYYVADAHTSESSGWHDATGAGRDAAVAAFDGGAGFTEATVVKYFPNTEIRRYIIEATDITPEAEQTMADQVPGDLCLPVRVWMTAAGGAVELLQDACQARCDAAVAAGETAFTHEGSKLVDAMPAECDDALHLYFALRPPYTDTLDSTSNLLFGIWHARAIPADEPLTGTETAELGRDFIVAAPDTTTGESRDQVAYGRMVDGTEYDYMDPDVVYVIEEERWRVYTWDQNELVYFEGTEAQVCTSWEDAWLADDELAEEELGTVAETHTDEDTDVEGDTESEPEVETVGDAVVVRVAPGITVALPAAEDPAAPLPTLADWKRLLLADG